MKKSVAILLVLALVFSFSISAIAESVTSADASSMRLVRTEGIVFLSDDSGSPLSIRDNMRLYSGNTVETASDSRAGISLDKTKTVTLDEDSAASLHSEGKNLGLKLESGAMYFSVSKPLEADENYEISTSTMVLGIRGTSGYVAAVSETESVVILTSGHALITAATGDEQEIAAGQRVVIRSTSSGAEFDVSSVTPYDFPVFLLTELAADHAMLAEADSQIGNHFRQTVLELLSPSAAAHSFSSTGNSSQASGSAFTPGNTSSDPTNGRQQSGIAQSVQDAYEEAYAAAQESYESAVAAAQESFANAFSNFGF